MSVPDLTDQPLRDLVSLKGRRAVVTGGARGLGAAIACRLAEAGASLVIGDTDEMGAQSRAEEIGGRFGVPAFATPLDAAHSSSIAETADFAVQHLGGIDIWVNNAGVYPSTPVLETTDEEWDWVLDTNLRGTFVGGREAARRMIATERGGVIVNVSSIAGVRGRGPGIAHYVASKHGIIGLTRQMALEFASHAIRVLAVAPTTIITAGVEEKLKHIDLEAALAGPLGRAGRPDDVARVVLFCASDLSLFMTGSTLFVDAGEMAR